MCWVEAIIGDNMIIVLAEKKIHFELYMCVHVGRRVHFINSYNREMCLQAATKTNRSNAI